MLVAEGYATGASLHEATGMAVVVALDSGNIGAVVAAIQARYPGHPLCIMGDDDRHQKDNVGRTKAMEAAHIYGVGVAFPVFASGHVDTHASDFNDLHQREGLEEVRRQVRVALIRCLDESRTRAIAYAHERCGASTQILSPGSNTRHTGVVLGVTPYHVIQESGNGRVVLHQTHRLGRIPDVGAHTTIQYAHGRAAVRPDHHRDKGRTR